MCIAGSFGAESGVDECIERIAESINYAHSRVEKVVTGIGNTYDFLDDYIKGRHFYTATYMNMTSSGLQCEVAY